MSLLAKQSRVFKAKNDGIITKKNTIFFECFPKKFKQAFFFFLLYPAVFSDVPLDEQCERKPGAIEFYCKCFMILILHIFPDPPALVFNVSFSNIFFSKKITFFHFFPNFFFSGPTPNKGIPAADVKCEHKCMDEKCYVRKKRNCVTRAPLLYFIRS